MFVANELKAAMAKNGYTQKRLAEELEMSPKTLWLRMNSGKWGTDEVFKIMEILKITDPVPIFFASK